MTILTLRDPQSGAQARILTKLGFNCFSWQVPISGQPLEILDAVPGFEDGQQRPVGSGNPLLFPFPNRIRGGKFTWNGQDYQIPVDSRGNAIHGFVADRPWRVRMATENSAVAVFHLSHDAPERLLQWPTDFLIEAGYTLLPNVLRLEIRIVNAGGQPLPWGFGTHPYFRLPLSSSSTFEQCSVHVPISEAWELEQCLPTGRRIGLDTRTDLATGVPLDGRFLDDVFTGVKSDSGKIVSMVKDPLAGLQISQVTDAIFREWVVFTPPQRPSVCVEPYTCVTDAINLQGRGLDAGLRVLGVGDEFRTWIELRVGPLVG